MRLATLLCLLLAAAPAFAGSPERDPLADAQAGLRETLRQFGPSIAGRAPLLGPEGALPFEPSVTPDLRRQLNADFGLLASLRGSDATPMHRGLYGDLRGENYKRYFDARVHRIGARFCGAPAAVACVSPLLSSDTMWIAPTYTTYDLPQVYRLMVLLHEARHTEASGRYYSHDACPAQDFEGHRIVGIFSGTDLTGAPACDERALGAYGVGLIFLKNVQRYCANCTDKVKMDAEFYGADTLKRISERRAYDQLRADLFE